MVSLDRVACDTLGIGGETASSAASRLNVKNRMNEDGARMAVRSNRKRISDPVITPHTETAADPVAESLPAAAHDTGSQDYGPKESAAPTLDGIPAEASEPLVNAPLSALPQKSGIGRAVFAGAVAGLVGGAFASFAIPAFRGPPPRLPVEEISARLTALEGIKLSTVTDASSQKPLADKLANLETKLTNLEAKATGSASQPSSPDPASSSAAGQEARAGANLATLVSRLEILEKSQGNISAASIAPRIEKMESSLGDVGKRQSNLAGATQLITTDALRRQFERGAPFAQELSAIESVADGSVNLAALKSRAESGLPSSLELLQKFRNISAQLLVIDRPPPSGILETLGAAASSLVKTRAVGEGTGRDPASILSRVEAALAKADAASALDELVKLSEPALGRAGPFMSDLKSRLEVEAAIRALEQNGLQRLRAK